MSMQTAHDRDWAFFAGDAMMEYGGHPTLRPGPARRSFAQDFQGQCAPLASRRRRMSAVLGGQTMSWSGKKGGGGRRL